MNRPEPRSRCRSKTTRGKWQSAVVIIYLSAPTPKTCADLDVFGKLPAAKPEQHRLVPGLHKSEMLL